MRTNYGKFDRFKKWARENIAGISAVAISVAGDNNDLLSWGQGKH